LEAIEATLTYNALAERQDVLSRASEPIGYSWFLGVPQFREGGRHRFNESLQITRDQADIRDYFRNNLSGVRVDYDFLLERSTFPDDRNAIRGGLSTHRGIVERLSQPLFEGHGIQTDNIDFKIAAGVAGVARSFAVGGARAAAVDLGGQVVDEVAGAPLSLLSAARFRATRTLGVQGTNGVAGPANVRIRTGASGELRSAFAKIEPGNIGQGTATNASSRAFARRLGNATDDAGHAVGRNLGGSGGVRSGNIFPQAPNVNRGAFNQFEQQIVRRVQAGDTVFTRIVPRYREGATRPVEILYQARINGQTISRSFPNQ